MATIRGPLFAAIQAMVLFLAPASRAAEPRYVSMAFHDVVDERANTDDNYAVTTGELVAFFEWLTGNGWKAITLDDIARANAGERPLPERSILITFDDGDLSLYTRVYPLLMAYRMPVVSALITKFLDPKADEEIRHDSEAGLRGSRPPAARYISWAEAREMDASGLVEFASHGYDLHHSELANPLGSELPAGAARLWSPSAGYETEDAFRHRIRGDLERSRSTMQRELGKPPRALAWPFGRYTSEGEEEARDAGFEFTLTLDPEPGTPGDLPLVPRLLPVRGQNLAQVITEFTSRSQTFAAVRLVRLDPESLPWRDPAAFEKALGAVLERTKKIGATWVVVDAAARGPSGKLEAAWFPNRGLPVKADVLSRIVWQLRTRSGVAVAISLPVDAARAALGSDAAVERLYQDMGVAALADAVLMEHAPGLAAIRYESSFSDRRWDIRKRRHAMDLSRLPAAEALAMRCFFAFERERPGRRLILTVAAPGATPSAVADLTLVETSSGEKPFRELVERLDAAGWLAAPSRYRSGILIRDTQPPSPAALSAAVRFFQRRGGVVFGWEPDDAVADRPKASEIAPAVSTAVSLGRL